MKTIATFALACIAAAATALPAQAQLAPGMGGYGRRRAPRRRQAPPLPQGHRDRRNPLGRAEDLRLAGRCDKAVPILRGIVDSPRRSGIAEYNLGLCLLDLAKTGANATKQRHQGAKWIVRAANDGFDMAQKKAVSLYLDGVGVKADPVEAEKWALLYHRNGTRMALGLPGLSSKVRSRLDARLSDAQRSKAESRAMSWHKAP